MHKNASWMWVSVEAMPGPKVWARGVWHRRQGEEALSGLYHVCVWRTKASPAVIEQGWVLSRALCIHAKGWCLKQSHSRVRPRLTGVSAPTQCTRAHVWRGVFDIGVSSPFALPLSLSQWHTSTHTSRVCPSRSSDAEWQHSLCTNREHIPRATGLWSSPLARHVLQVALWRWGLSRGLRRLTIHGPSGMPEFIITGSAQPHNRYK